MSDFTNFRDRNIDQQDHSERGLWGSVTHVSGAGSHMTVRGTGTLDEEVPVVNFGYSFNLPQNSNAEVIMLSLGSDVNAKVALPILPRDAQHPWPEGHGGMQHPTNPARRIEFNGNETYLKDGTFVLGHDRAVTVSVNGANVVINIAGNAQLVSAGTISIQANDVEITSATLKHNGVNVGFDHRHSGVDTGGGTSGEPV